MRIFYTAHVNSDVHEDAYTSEVLSTLKNLHVEIISLENGGYSQILKEKQIKKLKPDEITYLFVKTAIDKANAVIMDITDENFLTGHIATMSLMMNKPILCISQKRNFAELIKTPNFYGATYTGPEQLGKIIKSFVNEVKNKHLSVRFNGYLSPTQKNFLEWYGNSRNMNVSEVIRELINAKMDETETFKKD